MKVNERINFPEMRVIYVEDGQNKWKIMDRASALQFAKSMKLDLILGELLVMYLSSDVRFFRCLGFPLSSISISSISVVCFFLLS